MFTLVSILENPLTATNNHGAHTMLTFANKHYAKNDKEMIESLFTPRGTCSGFYKKRKNGWLLMNLQKEPIAFVVSNAIQGHFVVTASIQLGNLRFMHSTCSITEKLLGIDGMSYAATIEACRQCREIAE